MLALANAFAVMAALLHAVAYISYNLQTKSGASKPNPVSWAIWTILAILNAISYKEMSHDWVGTLQFYVGSVACVLTFCHALFTGKFSWPKKRELWCFALGIAASVVWWKYHNATAANLIVASALLISFVPTWAKVWNDPFAERPLPWMFWTGAFAVSLFGIFIRYVFVPEAELTAWAFVTPAVLLPAEAFVAFLCRDRRKADWADEHDWAG